MSKYFTQKLLFRMIINSENAESTVIDRIKQIIGDSKFSVLRFSKEIDFPYNTLNNYVTGQRSSIDINLIIKIISTFNEISPDWLLTGKGESRRKTLNENIASINNDDNLLMKTIIDLSGKLAIAEEKLKYLEDNRSGYTNAAEPIIKYGK